MTDPKAAVNKSSNRLIHATSPYLLQHAYNPVDWFEWTTEALDKAKKEDKPIVVSIGYSSCHWCHVMERESFENAELAAIMNEFFVCIKVDREERPDIDQVYMEAVQAMGINGGWPLNVFLTPDQKPFYGGTYFPASAWSQLLKNIHQAYQTRKTEINESADELTKIISSNGLDKFKTSNKTAEFSKSIEITYQQLEKKFDTIWGGLDKAPKFIMPSIWQWLLRYYYLTKSENTLTHINLTLTKILDGGIYDQAGGGFARYSVDGEWFAPHFEKMLYDNAQLVSLYADAFVVTQNPDYKRAVYETFDWLTREMTHPDGGFYSALDADSEGVEGKFYVWTKVELESILQDDAHLFCEYFGITAEGNWEHGQNILKRITSDENFIQKNNLNLISLTEILSRCKSKLLQVRENRVRPGLDDKILIGWNAMMITGLVDAYHAFGDDKFLESARRNLQFLETHLSEGTILYRSFKNKRSTTEAFLEDYAYVLNAYIKLYQVDFSEQHLHSAEKLAEYVIENFFDHQDGLFFYTNSSAEKLIARKKELFDNVIPSSNSLMAINLYQLGILLDNSSWKTMAEKMIANFAELIQNEPNYMSNWGIALLEMNNGLSEVAVVGKDAVELKNALRQHYLPFALFMGTETSSNFPLLKGKDALNNTSTLYICKDYSCKQPVHTVDDALLQLVNKS